MGRRVPQHSGKFAMKIKVMFGKTRQMTMIDVLAHRNIERMGLFLNHPSQERHCVGAYGQGRATSGCLVCLEAYSKKIT
jgi:hypothetical protein